MQKNPLAQLADAGQSVWYDQMERALIKSGTLRKLIERDDLRGLTSNPTIFEKAIGGSDDYNESLRQLADQQRSRDETYDAIVIDDISQAADAFAPVYDRTKGDDGYVSLEVSPALALDTAGTVSEAKRLWEKLDRRNAMIKIPATPEGIPAIEEAIAEGININITLIFSRFVYEKVIDAYLRGLETRVQNELPIDGIASVASFFVSRIDAAVDKELHARIEAASTDKDKEQLTSLLGMTAIANAKLAYQMFKDKFGGERFATLKRKGARLQRPLWASTGTKDPKYSDVLYIESLVGENTVNTIPPKTYEAFRDHGKVRPGAIEEDVEGAEKVLHSLEATGISLQDVTRKLTVEGVKSFSDSFDSLMTTIDTKRATEVTP